MIGSIKLPNGTEAELSDEGKWTCADDVMRRFLNLRFAPKDATGVGAVMPYGLMSIHTAAHELKGKVVSVPKVTPLEPGQVS